MEEIELPLDIDKIKPKEKWVYCFDVVGNTYIAFENVLYTQAGKVKFDEPILSVSAGMHLAVRTKSKVALVSRVGEVLWEKKVKSSAICHRNEYVAIGKNNRLIIYDIAGKELLSKKFKGDIMSIDLGDVVVVGSEKGVHVLSYEGNTIWEVEIGETTLVRLDDFIAAAVGDELVVISREGEVLWRYSFDSLIYEIVVGETVRVYLVDGDIATLTLDGKVVGVEKADWKFKFLPMPWIVVEKELEKLRDILKRAKKVKPKSAEKLAKEAKKFFKHEEYSKAYEKILQAYEEIKDAQIQVIPPKSATVGKMTTIIFRFHNFFDEIMENIEVDVSDLQKYFKVSETSFTLPPLRKDTYIEKTVDILPEYEGVFTVIVTVKSNFGDLHKKVVIKVRKPGFFSRLFTKEKERGLADLIS